MMTNMDNKLKRLAKNVTELLKNTETPQDTYYSLVKIMEKQKDYFQHMSPENILKLIFYCYSFGQTHSFEMADKMLDKIGFAVLIRNTGDLHKEECDDCSGNGEIACEHCYGDGTYECGQCDGSGEETCLDCDGTGEVEEDGEMVSCSECNGSGKVTCSDCDGEGTVECNYCSGGRETCQTCDGDGEIETEDYEYERFFIVTWDKDIKERCEYTEGSIDITMSEYDFDRLRGEYINLKMDDLWAPLNDEVESNEMYCPLYNDDPKLYLTGNMYLDTKEDKITPYTN